MNSPQADQSYRPSHLLALTRRELLSLLFASTGGAVLQSVLSSCVSVPLTTSVPQIAPSATASPSAATTLSSNGSATTAPTAFPAQASNSDDLSSACQWRTHPRLQGRFHRQYPDDLQVIVHDGGPRMTDRRPEVVWATVIGCDVDIYHARVLNQPKQLKTVKRGDRIRFVVPESGEYPILVTEKYLQERPNWIIYPCDRCGLSELFDPPSELIKKVFPGLPDGTTVEVFTAFCGMCGGVQRVLSRKSQSEAESKGNHE